MDVKFLDGSVFFNQIKTECLSSAHPYFYARHSHSETCIMPYTLHRDTVRWLVMFIELLIKLLESGLTAFSIHTNVIKIMIPKNGGHFERRAAIGQKNIPLNSYIAVSRAQ